MKPIIFRYKVVAGRWVPMISAGINLNGLWQPIELYVDSGATYTILRTKIAEDLGFNWKTGTKIFVQVGDGTQIPVYLHKLTLQIGRIRFKSTIGFSDKLGVSFHLLGRQDVFERFKICFQEKRRIVSFQPLS